jgi:hypothetical protein
MKKLFLFLCFAGMGLSLRAQQVNQCGILIPPQAQASARQNFTNVNEAATIIRTILNTINWKENFIVQEQNGINNAYATLIRNTRVIIYDNNFLTNLDAYAGTRWASISVLAHEMGHHYRNHILSQSGSTPSKELEADYFSGYVMGKLGATIEEASAAIQAVSSPVASATHPGRSARVNAIRQGWNYSRGLTAPTNGNARNPAPQPQQNPPPSTTGEEWIHLSLYGNSEMTVYLSDDGRTYNPAVLKPSQPFVFKFEIYKYGWLRFTQNGTTYKLVHGADYSVIWNRKTNNWTVVRVQ